VYFAVQFQLSYPELYSSRGLELRDKLTPSNIAETKQPLLRRSLTKLRNLRLWCQILPVKLQCNIHC